MTTIGLTICAVALALGGLLGSGTATGTPDPAPGASSSILQGLATWYAAPAGDAAAGPALRKFVGPGWRGTAVDVCRGGTTYIACVRVRLVDWCACGGGRIIDLSDDAFRSLAPLSRGVIRVRVAVGAPARETITQPPTDTEP